jgi:ABC-2 type transport system ATP-binding protein
MTILETNGLTKKYGSLTAVDHVSLSVDKGQVFGFLGPNGSGKTTTIGMLLGIITPTGGNFRMFGRDGSDELHAARRRIGATLETPNFYPVASLGGK